jgi:hypothetical protein
LFSRCLPGTLLYSLLCCEGRNPHISCVDFISAVFDALRYSKHRAEVLPPMFRLLGLLVEVPFFYICFRLFILLSQISPRPDETWRVLEEVVSQFASLPDALKADFVLVRDRPQSLSIYSFFTCHRTQRACNYIQ